MRALTNRGTGVGRCVGRSLAAGACLVLSLAGCSDYGTREFGVRRDLQERTRVVSPPPLSQPPILAQRAVRSDDQPAVEAEAAVPSAASSNAASRTPASPTPASPAAPASEGEMVLLGEAGPPARADIREKVDQEAQLGRVDPGRSDAILFGQPSQHDIIQRGSSSWWDRIF